MVGTGIWDPLGNIQSLTHDRALHVNSVVPSPLIIRKAELVRMYKLALMSCECAALKSVFYISP